MMLYFGTIKVELITDLLRKAFKFAVFRWYIPMYFKT